jgi:MFS family permease
LSPMKLLLLLLFCCMWFLNFTTRAVISPLLPVIEDELGITHALAGSLIFFLSIGYAVSLLLSGVLSPRMGYKRILFATFLTTGLSTMGSALVTFPPVLVGLLFLQASFNAVFFPVGLVAISKLTGHSERSAFTGAAVAAGVIFGLGLTPPSWAPSQTTGASRPAFSAWDLSPSSPPG